MTAFCCQLKVAVLLLCLGTCRLTLAGEPIDRIRQTTDKILAIVQAPALKGPEHDVERQRQMKQAAAERFDWAAMARGAMGKNWRDLSDAQRVEFTDLFSELIAKTYMSKVQSYSGEKIRYQGDKVDGDYGVVAAVIVTLRGSDIPVTYQVMRKGADWRVYDVCIEGVSLVNNYRSQIDAILDSSSYDNLIRRIREKTAGNTAVRENKSAGATAAQKPGDSVL